MAAAEAAAAAQEPVASRRQKEREGAVLAPHSGRAGQPRGQRRAARLLRPAAKVRHVGSGAAGGRGTAAEGSQKSRRHRTALARARRRRAARRRIRHSSARKVAPGQRCSGGDAAAPRVPRTAECWSGTVAPLALAAPGQQQRGYRQPFTLRQTGIADHDEQQQRKLKRKRRPARKEEKNCGVRRRRSWAHARKTFTNHSSSYTWGAHATFVTRAWIERWRAPWRRRRRGRGGSQGASPRPAPLAASLRHQRGARGPRRLRPSAPCP